jgi:ABC-type spermidine/putrescine transport system permease subunit I
VLLAVFFIGPVLYLARLSLYEGGGSSGFGIGSGGFYQPNTWSLSSYINLLTDKYFRDVFLFTILLGIGVTLLTLLLAYPLALTIHELSPRLKVLALTAVILPKLTNPLLIVYGLVLILSNTGPVNNILQALGIIAQPLTLVQNLLGVVIGETYLGIPYAVLILVTALDRIDDRLAAAAAGLGASPWTVFWRVTFPLSLPGLALATTITLIFALGAFVTSYLLGSPEQITLAVDIQKQTFENLNWPKGAAEAVIPLLISIGILVLSVYEVPAKLKLARSSRLREETP